MPQDPRALRLVSILRKRPEASLSQAAAQSGVSLRTLERLFAQQTGMSLGAWFRRIRIQLAIEHLSAGKTVTATSRICAYGSPSAFISMFHRELGFTPGECLGAIPPQTQTAHVRKRS